MRKPVKFRIAFFLVAAVCFYIGTYFLPDNLPVITFSFHNILASPEWRNTFLVTLVYFVFLPVLHYFWIIRIGEQAWWKVLIILSLSSLVARYYYPQQLADYFAFISYLKYPFIAVLVIIEIVLMLTIIRAMWGARKLSGDPRIHMLQKYESDKTEKKGSKEAKQLELALMFAHEPASWYYAIPRFSKNHAKSLVNLNLLSAKWWHFSSILLALIIATYLSYVALTQFSETVAIVVATLVFYLIVMFVANYRVSKHHSVYFKQDKLMINNSWWGMTFIPLSNIQRVEVGKWPVPSLKAHFHFGKGDANVKLTFNSPQRYYCGLATFNEAMDELYLSVDDPAPFTTSPLFKLC